MPDDLTKRVRTIDHLALIGDRGAPAVLLKDAVLNHAELELRVGRLAFILNTRALPPGSRVASWSGKTWLACILPLAAVRAGLAHVPINPLLKRGQAAHIVSDSGAALLLTNAGRASSLLPGDLHDDCEVVDDAAMMLEVEQTGDALPPSNGDPGALAAILYTSGSTGRPKGVMLTSRNLWLGAESVAKYSRLTPEDRVLGVLPLSFDYGQNQLLSAWFAGASVAPLDYLTPRDVVRAVDRFRATTLAGVPPLWTQLLETGWPIETAAHLRRLTNSGGALTRPMIASLRARFPAADLYAMYGLTEAFRSTYLDPQLIEQRPTSIGRAIPHAEVLIVRPDGTACAPDEPGELVHCGPLVAAGYWGDAERTALRFRPAPPHAKHQGMAVWSGDTARADADGFITFVGRDDEMIKSSGNRISPTEIEQAAMATGLIVEAVALGVADAALGQAIALVVRSKSSEDSATVETSLRAAFRSELPNFMQPRHVLVRDQLPRNANGKLDRSGIAAEVRAALMDASV